MGTIRKRPEWSCGDFERNNIDHLKPQYFNPYTTLQKAGHGSLVDLPNGESYLVHLCARPFVPELRCTLGRETAIQKMKWTDEGWLRIYGGKRIRGISGESNS